MASNKTIIEYKYRSTDLSTLITTLKSVSDGLATVISALSNEQREMQNELNTGSYDYHSSSETATQAEERVVSEQLKILENIKKLVDEVHDALNEFYSFTNETVKYNSEEEFNYDTTTVLSALGKMKSKVESQETYNEIVKESNSFDFWEVGNNDNITLGKNDRRQRDAYRHNRHLTDELNDYLNTKFESVKTSILEANTMNSINYDEFIGGKLIDDLLRNVNLDREGLDLKNFKLTEAEMVNLTGEEREQLERLREEVGELESKIKDVIKDGIENEKKINSLRNIMTKAEEGDTDDLTNLIAAIIKNFDDLPLSVQSALLKIWNFMETSDTWKVLDKAELTIFGMLVGYSIYYFAENRYMSYDVIKKLTLVGVEYISGEIVEKIGFWLGGIAAAALTDGLGATVGAAIGAELGAIIGDIVAAEIAGKTVSYAFDCIFDEGPGGILLWDEDVTDFIYEVGIEIDEYVENPSIETWNQIIGNITIDVDEIFYGA